MLLAIKFIASMMHQAKKELILEHAKQGGFPANSVGRFANVIRVC